MRSYPLDALPPIMIPPSPKKRLAQAMVPPTTLRKLDALARARGCSRAAYLARLIQTHVRVVTPRILRALDEASPRTKEIPR